MASIAPDDALILPHRANPRWIGFSGTTGPDHLGPELISERLVTGSVLVASDLPELVFPPVSALCASLRSLSVTYITDRVGKPASYAYVLGRWKAMRVRSN